MTPTRVHALLQGNWLDTNQGAIVFCAVTLVEGEDADGHTRRIVVDPGSSGRGGALDAALAIRRLTRADIDTVVLTHAHWDHMQNLDLFDGATICLHPDELAYVANPHPRDTATPRWTRAVLDQYDLCPVHDGTELMPGVSILDVRGHSAGTVAVAATTAEGVALITGDAVQNVDVARNRRNPLVFWDDAMATQSIDRIIAAADIIHPGHDGPFRMSPSGNVEYLVEHKLIVTGPPHDIAGITLQAAPPAQRLVAPPETGP